MNNRLPVLIQGGMGVGVSAWPLARAVAQCGQLGVVSGTGLDVVLIRRLQDGDPGGHVRRAMAAFPMPEIADRILSRYFLPEGRRPGQPYRGRPLPRLPLQREFAQLCVVANFVEVYLAREGHDGQIGINFMEKLQLPLLPSLYGAMLAGVDWVLVGAGIPWHLPEVIDRFVDGMGAELPIDVVGAENGAFCVRFDPAEVLDGFTRLLPRPRFLPIISSAVLANMLLRRARGTIDGFVVEGPTAGGHNAPPRGRLKLNDRGEPVYGPRDDVDLAAMRRIGLPFWLAGSYGSPERVAAALEEGAAGVQVGTLFAYCVESGLDPSLRRAVLEAAVRGEADCHTDPFASPTGFPFKIVQLPGTLAEEPIYRGRRRVCDLGYLRQAYVREDGSVGWRCPAEPIEQYVRKGGDRQRAEQAKCLCNALMANIGLAQRRKDGAVEPPLLTSGDAVRELHKLLAAVTGGLDYTARDVVTYLLSGVPSETVRCPAG